MGLITTPLRWVIGALLWFGMIVPVTAYALYLTRSERRDGHSGLMTVVRFTRWCFTGKSWS